ncbi:MAG: sulfatase-like hydrolase/transferase [Planctomycetota bacterium JB042]
MTPSRRGFLKGVAAGAAAAAWAGCRRGAPPREDGPPNVLLVVADDLGIGALSLYGEAGIETPRLARLAAEGMRFETVWSTPLCTPSRVELLTGRYPCRTGWTDNIQARFEPGFAGKRFVDPAWPSLGRVMRDAGYRTAVAGKWQLCRFDERPDHPAELGFEEHRLWSWMEKGSDGRALVQTARYWNPSVVEGGVTTTRDGAYGPHLFRDFLADFMRRRRDEPFFAYYPMALPHPPYQPPPSRAAAGDPATRSSDPAFFPDMVAALDAIVGELVDAVDALGLGARTLVLFTSDNGTPGEIPVRRHGVPGVGGKGTLSEAGVRVPLIARWTGVVAPGTVTPALVDLSDVLPTLAELSGAADVPETDGVSFLPVLVGKEGARRTIFSQLGDARAIRGRRWKLDSDVRLFDLVNDPLERFDLGADPARKGLVDGLGEVLDAVCR